MRRRQKYPKIKKVTREEKESLMGRVRSSTLAKVDGDFIENAMDTLEFITGKLEEKNIQLEQLVKQMLGIKSEKSSKVLEQIQSKQSKIETEESADNCAKNDRQKQKIAAKKFKGHGRNGVEKYTGAEKVKVAHSELNSGCACPGCSRGKVYNEKKPGVFIHIEGKAPIQATIYETEKLRCNLCGEIFEADLPVEAPTKKHYDETAKSMMAILRYGHGLPLNRLEKLQAGMGIPLPASTAWEKTQEAAEEIMPVYEELTRLAAQGNLIYNDDTGMKILETMALIKNESQKANGKKIRTGIFTTGIVSEVEENKIALFFTGRKHAGENLDDLLKKRESDRSPPIQMCDGKTGNTLETTDTIISNCNTHARRCFVDVSNNFPNEVAYVLLKFYKEIYKNDAHTRKQNMSPEQRLLYHQKNSKSIMQSFYEWLERQFKKKLVEENSSLGKAISYTLKRWTKLTRFLHISGAPLDNNICERALKRAICHRKNSLFYKTPNGARVGDIFMSLIHTCAYVCANPFDYFTQLQRHSSHVIKDPSKWLPWNYQLQFLKS